MSPVDDQEFCSLLLCNLSVLLSEGLLLCWISVLIAKYPAILTLRVLFGVLLTGFVLLLALSGTLWGGYGSVLVSYVYTLRDIVLVTMLIWGVQHTDLRRLPTAGKRAFFIPLVVLGFGQIPLLWLWTRVTRDHHFGAAITRATHQQATWSTPRRAHWQALPPPTLSAKELVLKFRLPPLPPSPLLILDMSTTSSRDTLSTPEDRDKNPLLHILECKDSKKSVVRRVKSVMNDLKQHFKSVIAIVSSIQQQSKLIELGFYDDFALIIITQVNLLNTPERDCDLFTIAVSKAVAPLRTDNLPLNPFLALITLWQMQQLMLTATPPIPLTSVVVVTTPLLTPFCAKLFPPTHIVFDVPRSQSMALHLGHPYLLLDRKVLQPVSTGNMTIT